jgi:hypothetical protein
VGIISQYAFLGTPEFNSARFFESSAGNAFLRTPDFSPARFFESSAGNAFLGTPNFSSAWFYLFTGNVPVRASRRKRPFFSRRRDTHLCGLFAGLHQYRETSWASEVSPLVTPR